MKKKIALALAAILALSAMPMTIFAASDNRVTFTIPSVAEKTMLVPASAYVAASRLGAPYAYIAGKKDTDDRKEIKEFKEAPTLVLKIKDTLTPSTAFRLKLTNAKWSFGVVSGETSVASTALNVVSGAASGLTTLPITSGNHPTFDQTVLVPSTTDVQYKFTTTSDTEALVSILSTGDASNYTPGNEKSLRIPLPMYVEETSKAVTVAMTDNGTTLSESSFVIVGESAGGTTNTAASIKSGREIIKLDTISLKETRLDAIKASGAFEIEAPVGYKFTNAPNTWRIFSDPGILMDATLRTPTKAQYLDTSGGDGESYALYIKGIQQSHDSTVAKTQGAIKIENIKIEPVDPDNVVEGQELSLTINEYDTANQGSKFNDPQWKDAKNTEAVADYNPTITAFAASGSADAIAYGTDLKDLGVTASKFVVAKVITTGIGLSVIDSKVPTLVAGRFDSKADSKEHETAEIKFNELEAKMWAATNRTTTFTVPEGVLIRGVDFTKTDKLSATDYVDVKGTLMNGEKTAYTVSGSKVTINGRKMEIKSPTLPSGTDKATLQFKLYLSIDPNYTGSTVDLTVSGSSLPEQLEPITIANVVKPIEVTGKTTDVQIGFQTFKVSDITITENAAGNIKKGEPLFIKIDDNEMSFHNITSDQVTATNGLKLTLQRTNNGVMSFDVDRESSGTPGTITITGVEVKIDRTVPYGTYDLLVYGDSVFQNYLVNSTSTTIGHEKLVAFGDYDEGFRLPAYINVKTEGSNSALKANVKIQQDSTSAIVDGKVIELPLAPKNINGRIMVPLKFMANVFGIEDSSITWYDGNMFGEPDNRVATITSGTTTVEFKIGSPIYTINRNGAKIQRPIDNQGTKAFIDPESSRIFLPFAAMGEAFDVPVKWDADSKTAIYNPEVE